MVSIVVPVLVTVLLTPGLMPKIELPFDPHILSGLNAIINGLTTLVLLTALYFVKNGKIEQHQKMMTLAMVLSALFLVFYVLYHWSAGHNLYGDLNHDNVVSDAEKLEAGVSRTFYLGLLSSHILLAAVLTPFVLFTFLWGISRQDARHRKLAKIAFPIWLYVSVTGVICYLMISPYYQ